MALGVGLLLRPVEDGEVSGDDRSTWQGFGNSRRGRDEVQRLVAWRQSAALGPARSERLGL
jgi:hypothetical protein